MPYKAKNESISPFPTFIRVGYIKSEEKRVNTEKKANKLYDVLLLLQLDKRLPHVLRLGPCPLYNSFSDIYRFVEILRQTFVKLAL
jgi:hypothetical protein